jgi:hypothetical protein
MPTKKKLVVVNRLDEIPRFGNETEEHEFWATHELSDSLWDQAEPLSPDELPPPRPATTTVVIRLDDDTIRRAKTLARRRHKTYEELLADMLTSLLAEEERRTG